MPNWPSPTSRELMVDGWGRAPATINTAEVAFAEEATSSLLDLNVPKHDVPPYDGPPETRIPSELDLRSNISTMSPMTQDDSEPQQLELEEGIVVDRDREPDEESRATSNASVHSATRPQTSTPASSPITSSNRRFAEQLGTADLYHESDEESSVTSDATFNRMARAPVLPSASSASNIRHLTEKIARVRVRQSQSPATSNRLSKSRTRLEHVRTDYSARPPSPAARMYHIGPTSPTSDSFGMGSSQHDLRPTLREQGRSYNDESEDEEDSGPDYEPAEFRRITEQWAKLREQRDAIKTTFQKMRKKRIDLADLRQRKNDATLALMNQVRQLLPHHPQLVKHFKETETLNSEYLGAENGLDELIDELQDQETQIELQERQFFTTVAQSDASSEPENRRAASRMPSRTSLRGINGDRPEDYHPLFEGLREALKDLRLAKEHDMNLTMKKRLIDSKEKKDLTEEDKDFLEDHDALQQQARTEIERWIETAKDLEMQCKDKQVMPKHVASEGGLGLETGFRDEIYLESDYQGHHSHGKSGARAGPISAPKSLAHPRFPLLLSNPKSLLEPFPRTAEQHLRMAASLPPGVPLREKALQDAQKEFGIQSLITGHPVKDKQDFVNRWLLQRLRCSAIEAQLLASTFSRFLKILDVERWQRDVLYFWSRDQAAMPSIPSMESELSNHPADSFGGIYASISSVGPDSRSTQPSIESGMTMQADQPVSRSNEQT